MLKRVCDRCGKTLNVDEDSVLKTHYILYEEHYNILDSNDIKVDLCSECSKRFQFLVNKFMNEV